MKECYKKILSLVISFFQKIFKSKKSVAVKDAEMRKHMTEKQVDKMVKDSFPSSDPPSTY